MTDSIEVSGVRPVDEVEPDVEEVPKPDILEEQALVGKEQGEQGQGEDVPPLEIKFNLELLRAVGLVGILFALVLGTILTTYVTEWPVVGEPFDFEQTFIFKLFGFNHTCTMIDFNPSRTIAACITIIFNVIPLTAFAFLNHYRIQHDYRKGKVKKSLATFSKFASPVMGLCFLLFPLVYVNFPEDIKSFTLHYIPFFTYQLGVVLMEVQHIHYLLDREKMPFNIPKVVAVAYYWLVVGFWVFYSVFVWSFIAESPILDTAQSGQLAFAQFVMFFFMVITTIIPAAFATYESRDPEISTVILTYTIL